jgi:hypothetical protein
MHVPIRPHLSGQRFDAETIRVMGLAFEMALVALRLADRGDLANDILAQKIMALAKSRRARSRAVVRRRVDGISPTASAGMREIPQHGGSRSEGNGQFEQGKGGALRLEHIGSMGNSEFSYRLNVQSGRCEVVVRRLPYGPESVLHSYPDANSAYAHVMRARAEQEEQK